MRAITKGVGVPSVPLGLSQSESIDRLNMSGPVERQTRGARFPEKIMQIKPRVTSLFRITDTAPVHHQATHFSRVADGRWGLYA